MFYTLYSICRLRLNYGGRALMNTMVRAVSSLTLMSLLTSCGGGQISLRESTPSSPSVGEVSGKTNPQLSKALIKRLKNAQIILIGETHDHPKHHLIQAEVIRLVRPKSVAFEMLNNDQQTALDALGDVPSDQWDQTLAWSKRGWPAFDLYRPVFDAALSVGAKLIAAHPTPATIHPLKLGADLPSQLRKELKLDTPLPTVHREALFEELREAHCGHAPPAIAEAMLKAQRLKDAWMGNAVLNSSKPTVLIVGRGHIHPRRGIPWAIQNLRASAKDEELNVQVLSLSATKQPSFGEDEAVMSQVYVEPHRNDDPCERFREQLEKMKKAHQTHTSDR